MARKRRKKKGMKLVNVYCMWMFLGVILGVTMAFTIKLVAKEGTFTTDVEANVATIEQTTAADEWVTTAEQKLIAENTNLVVMLDPGHGGDDPGTMNGSTYEKDITLPVALKVKEYLEECGITVMMTREDDTFMNRYDRAELANSSGVDIFVSIHCNYLEDNPEISGVETYYIEGATDGEQLATALHENVLRVTGADDMYLRTDEFVVIKNTEMPAALIEIGYLSNSEDVRKLATASYQSEMAYGIAAGIVNYINNVM